MHDAALTLGEASATRRQPIPARRSGGPRQVQESAPAPGVPGPCGGREQTALSTLGSAIGMDVVAVLHGLRALRAEVERCIVTIQGAAGGELVPDITREVARICHVTPDEILGRCRTNRIAWARQVLMVALVEAGFTSVRAGQLVGGRDHGTVCHARHSVADWVATSERHRLEWEAVLAFVRLRTATGGALA